MRTDPRDQNQAVRQQPSVHSIRGAPRIDTGTCRVEQVPLSAQTRNGSFFARQQEDALLKVLIRCGARYGGHIKRREHFFYSRDGRRCGSHGGCELSQPFVCRFFGRTADALLEDPFS